MIPLNPMFVNRAQNPFSNFQIFQQQFNSFAQTFQQQNQGVNPQQLVQGMLNNGQMSQQQFNQCRMMANQITGMNF